MQQLAVVSVNLVAHGTSVGAARRFVTEHLVELGLEALVDDAVLAVSELVGNAVLHSRTPIEVRLTLGESVVRVDVIDASEHLPVKRNYGGYATTGRGLALVEALATEVGVDHHATGKSIWFTLTHRPEEGTDPAEPEPADPSEIDLVAEPLVSSARVTVAVLQDVPVALWLAARQHHEAALREMALYQGPRLGPTLEEWAWFGAASNAHADLDGAIQRSIGRELTAGGPAGAGAGTVPAVVTVTLAGDEHLPSRMVTLLDVLDEAERLAAADELLVRPALAEVVALRDWCCEQVIAQAAGSPPTAWGGDPVPQARRTRAGVVVPLPVWDASEVLASPRCLVAADDHNRVLALSPAAAALLGWEAGDIVGRRLVALIPQRFREAHIAVVTRYLTTRESHVVGTGVPLPMLRADGREVPCSVDIVAMPAGSGRTVFLATLTPLPARTEATGDAVPT